MWSGGRWWCAVSDGCVMVDAGEGLARERGRGRVSLA